ncbi:hypothetical protein [Actinomadura madurae]|uniref:hypothetical protein n=1 Tax=Actinomadura madurae TaxID=1993 RepID=UPI0020D2181A|nr:hypothetical protein [Actinomadura madurae]MCP9966972.1 hypothetical protein [Actinomadura madurae]MCQ0009027.1 hypothetical protein [Actinomadura madurae]MCQ0015651.1 hypothetical protein [Actinomadura madurae]
MTIQVLLGVEDRDLAASLTGQFRELPDIKIIAVEASSNHLASTVATVPQLDVVLVHQGLGPLPPWTSSATWSSGSRSSRSS